MTDIDLKKKRPLSPHLQVYRLPMTAVMSISHRMSGIALSLGLVMLVWMLVATAMGPSAYGVFHGFIASWLGQFMLMGWSAALFYHMCNGIRHLFWDMGFLFELDNAFKSGLVVIFMAVLLTALTWWFACPWMDGDLPKTLFGNAGGLSQ
jgi:succinate dehydrogenase / fumarate reductase cytochrome b subunit